MEDYNVYSKCKGCGETEYKDILSADGYCEHCQYELEQKQDHKTEQE